MSAATRLNRLEKSVTVAKEEIPYHSNGYRVVTGDPEEDGFIARFGVTRCYLDPAFYNRSIFAILEFIADGAWHHVHNELHPALEKRFTWQELNVVMLKELQAAEWIEKRKEAAAKGGWWSEIRLTEKGRRELTLLLAAPE